MEVILGCGKRSLKRVKCEGGVLFLSVLFKCTCNFSSQKKKKKMFIDDHFFFYKRLIISFRGFFTGPHLRLLKNLFRSFPILLSFLSFLPFNVF